MPEISGTGAHAETPATQGLGGRSGAPAAEAAPGWLAALGHWLGGVWRRLRGLEDWDDGIRGRSARQFIGALRATYAAIRAREKESPPKNLTDGIEAILHKYARPDAKWTATETWDDAYQLELLMINILDPERLDVELEARIKDAKDKGVPTASQFEERRKAQAQAQTQAQAQGQTQTPEQAQEQAKSRGDRDRAMLQRLTEDLQWFSNTRDQRRRYAKQAQTRASLTFVGAMLLFGAVMFNTFSFGTLIERRAEAERVAQEEKALAALEAAEKEKQALEAAETQKQALAELEAAKGAAESEVQTVRGDGR